MADSQIYLGVVLELGGKEISLEPQTAITEIKTKGMEVGLPNNQAINIGGVGENLKSILDSLGVESDFLVVENNGVTVEGLPDIEALKNITELLFDAQLAVQKFHVKVPPTHREIPPATSGGTPTLEIIPVDQRGETKYTIGMSAVWLGDSGTLFGSLKLKGLFFKASNEGG